MTLPASGAISMSQVNTELGLTATATISLNQTAVRTLFGKASGTISMADGYGKANAWSGTITTSTSNMNLRTWAIAAGWNGTSAASITVNSGVYIYATSTANAGLTIDGSWPSGITLINNGYIIGMGASTPANSAASAGGNAISLGASVSITNNSYIAGGGGSGGSSGIGAASSYSGGGGGAGGGAGGPSRYAANQPASGGAGGGIGAVGSSGTSNSSPVNYAIGAAGGGRVLPGTGGSAGYWPSNLLSGVAATGGGAGGGGATSFQAVGSCGPGFPRFVYYGGGGGGGWGANGGNGGVVGQSCGTVTGVLYAGAGGSANNNGGAAGGGTIAGGAGGKAVALNGYSVTWIATGTRYGAIA